MNRAELIRQGPPDMKYKPEHSPTWKERIGLRFAPAYWAFTPRQNAIFDQGRFPWYVTPRHIDDFPWPSLNVPERITCSHLDYNEAFRHWVAWCVEYGSQLHIVQHGGGFGSMKVHGLEDHYLSICDVFYSWGWSGPKVQPGPSWWLQRQAKRIKTNPSGYIYWVLNAVPKEPYREMSFPQGEQFREYLDDQFTLAGLLSPQLRRQIVLRLYPEDYGWKIREQWQSRFPDIRIEKPGMPITKGLSGSKLAIVTTNTTTLLECLAANHPTVAFLNPKHWELRESAKPYFRLLREEAGILAGTPSETVDALRRARWPNWWRDRPIQSQREEFCREFART